jgi:hypothetical protein
LGIPTTLLGIPNQFLPPRLADPDNALVQGLTIGDLTAFGLPRPEDGFVARFRATDVVPIIDVGLVQPLRSGRVEPDPAVTGFDEEAVHLADRRAAGRPGRGGRSDTSPTAPPRNHFGPVHHLERRTAAGGPVDHTSP